MVITASAPRRRGQTQVDDDKAAALLTEFVCTDADHPARHELRGRVIRAFLPLARHLAVRYYGRGEPLDDLVQTATIGLINAVDRFDPGYGTDFVGYAVPTITGEIKRHFRDRTWSMRVPRKLQERRIALARATQALTNRLRRSPTVAELAVELDISEEEVLDGLEGARAYHAVSLSTPTAANRATELGDTLSDLDDAYERVELRIALGPALAALDEREQEIIGLRFYGNLTQTQIAERIGVSQMHVSRLLTKALAKLRPHLTG
ncbi:SigB/SigF/SigG family RNA polymerase sigma factor [Plantactinospora solaniradicis]|uniref:SigB/SigF/SigG family RNA polymerase sigma factor n=1 Tax=Plantactinospora solaniradicis TaxID=1723736 RepID=A0ABW1KHW2_9ACTN